MIKPSFLIPVIENLRHPHLIPVKGEKAKKARAHCSEIKNSLDGKAGSNASCRDRLATATRPGGARTVRVAPRGQARDSFHYARGAKS